MCGSNLIKNSDSQISWMPLSDLLLHACDGPRNIKESNKGVPYVRLRDLRNDLVCSACESFTSIEGIADRFFLKEGDVLIAKTGEEPRGTLIGNKLKSGIFSADVYRMRPDPSRLSSSWLTAFFNTKYAHKVIRKLSYGTRIRRIKMADLKRILIPLPPKNIVSDVDHLVSEAQQLSEAAKDAFVAVERGIYSEISQRIPEFSGEPSHWLTVSNENLAERWDIPYVRNLIQIKTLGSNALLQQLSDVAKIATSSRKMIKPDAQVRYVQTADIDSKFLTFSQWRTCMGKDLPPRVRLPLQEYQVLLLASGQSIGTHKQPVAVVEPELQGCMASNAFLALEFSKTPIYFAMVLRHPFVLGQLRALSSGGTIPFLSKKIIKNLKVPVLGGIWREDFNQRAQIAWEKRKLALESAQRAVSIVEEFIQANG